MAEIKTVSQLIESAFFGNKDNIVNFKLIQTILMLIAKQLRIEDRKVFVNVSTPTSSDTSLIVIKEVKVKAGVFRRDVYVSAALTDHGSTGFKAIGSKTTKQVQHPSEKTKTISDSTTRGPKVDKIPSEHELATEDYHKLLDKVEEERERILRVINQRSNSREEGVRDPTPMMSVQSAETKGIFDKILVVQRVSVGDQGYTNPETSPIKSLVTKEEFEELLDRVNHLTKLQNSQDAPPQTEIRAVLQMSSRLEKLEKLVEKFLSMVATVTQDVADKRQSKSELTAVRKWTGTFAGNEEISDEGLKPITKEEFKEAVGSEYQRLEQILEQMLKKQYDKIDEFLKVAPTLVPRLVRVEKSQIHFMSIEKQSRNLMDRINDMDTAMASQITHIQEQINSVQFEIDTALDSLAQMMSTKGSDPERILDLHQNFALLRDSINWSVSEQKRSYEVMLQYREDFLALKKAFEQVLETKCDREEFVDALRDKAGLADLNGYVDLNYFGAVYGYIQDKINNIMAGTTRQEKYWQKALNEIDACMDEKANIEDLKEFRDDTQKHLNTLNNKLDAMIGLFQQPVAAAVRRAIIRNSVCVSCNSPATVTPETKPKQKAHRRKIKGVQCKETKDNADAAICVPGYRVPDRIPPTAELCSRYCGGAHTTQTLPTPLKFKEAMRLRRLDGTTDEQVEELPENLVKIPCIPCNRPKETKRSHKSLDSMDVDAFFSSRKINSEDYVYGSNTSMLYGQPSIYNYSSDDDPASRTRGRFI